MRILSQSSEGFPLFSTKKDQLKQTRNDRLLKIIIFDLTRYNGQRMCGLILTGPRFRPVFLLNPSFGIIDPSAQNRFRAMWPPLLGTIRALVPGAQRSVLSAQN